MKNFSAEFIAKKSLNYYESLSKDVIREVMVRHYRLKLEY